MKKVKGGAKAPLFLAIIKIKLVFVGYKFSKNSKM
jgi:hypothetical protein